MLEGVLGAEIPGDLDLPARASATHRSASSCVQCHMGESNVASVGGHSWNPVEETCIECHGAVPDSASDYAADMALLKSLLEQVVGEEILYDANGDPTFDANGNPVGTGNPVVGIILDDYPDPGETDRSQPGIYSDVAARAAWNYKTVLEDQSRGIHNPDYTKYLLKNAIQALQNEN